MVAPSPPFQNLFDQVNCLSNTVPANWIGDMQRPLVTQNLAIFVLWLCRNSVRAEQFIFAELFYQTIDVVSCYAAVAGT